MSDYESYQAKEFNLSGLNGISDRTLDMHFKLHEGDERLKEEAPARSSSGL